MVNFMLFYKSYLYFSIYYFVFLGCNCFMVFVIKGRIYSVFTRHITQRSRTRVVHIKVCGEESEFIVFQLDVRIYGRNSFYLMLGDLLFYFIYFK